MQDFIGQEVTVGDYFAYPLIVGRSASMAIYKLHSTFEDGRVKAIKQDESYGFDSSYKYKKTIYNVADNKYECIDMTPAEREKVDNRTSTLNMFSERAVLLKDFRGKE